jgi:hypothetical protein
MNCGFLYKLQDNTNPDLVYYGSSELTTLDECMKIHIHKFNDWKNTGKYYCYSFKVLERNNYTPILLKIVFFTIQWELQEQKRKLIEYQTCVNKFIPNRTKAEWYEVNKDKIKKQSADYRVKNKDKIKKKFTCPCGGKYTYQNKVQHIKSNKHQDWLKLQTQKNI